MFTRAIVCPPAENFAQGLTSSDLGSPDYDRALAQHRAYCEALENCGLTLSRLAADSRHPDSTFVEDTAILIEPAAGNTEFHAVLTRPGAGSRLRETERIGHALLNFFPSLPEIQLPGTVDGGDICQAGSHFFIGVSLRTNEHGAQQLAGLLRGFGYTSTLIDIRHERSLLHLKSGIAYLGDNCLVVGDALTTRADFDGYDVISVAPEEAYAANCIRVNDLVLIASGHPQFGHDLRQRGFQVVTLEMSEFQKMDGGLSCLSLRF